MAADQPRAGDLATRLADYIATSNTPWPDESAMRDAVRETVRLMCTEARPDALSAMGMKPWRHTNPDWPELWQED